MLFILNELIYRLVFLNIYGLVYRNFPVVNLQKRDK